MSMHSKVSIIVPIYNVEKYLCKCVDSILNQQYYDLEVILVDDGSTDHSGEIADSYKEKDKRIIVIHKQNGGLSSARNGGLDIAHGDYIGFVDSDDWIEPNMYADMMNAMCKYKCDVVECAVNIVEGDNIRQYTPLNDEIISGKEAVYRQLRSISNTDMPRIAVWSKLFKADYWRNKRFPVGKIHEDYMLTCEAFYCANTVALIKHGLYNHLVSNNQSIMNSKFGKKDLYLEKQYYSRVVFFEGKKEPLLTKLALENYYLLLLSLFWRCELNGMEEKKYYKDCLMSNKEVIKSMSFSKRQHMEFRMFFISPKLYMIFRKSIMRLRG